MGGKGPPSDPSIMNRLAETARKRISAGIAEEAARAYGIILNLPRMSPAELQQNLFRQVKDRLPKHVSMPEEIASLLGISADSAYRRIRGEKPMDLGELALVCSTYKLSLDALVAQSSGQFIFNGRFVGAPDHAFGTWLAGMNAQLEQLAAARDPLFIFRAEDIPTFHYFQFPELAHFKLFFWRRTILDMPEFQQRKFAIADMEPEVIAMAQKTHLTYMRLPTTEIWNADCLNAFLRQLGFYRDAGIFRSESDAQSLYDALIRLIDHLEAEAEAGAKFLAREPAATGSGRFTLYVNEVMQGDNMIYAEAGGSPIVFINHSAINYVATMDATFCEFARKSMDTIMRRSILISGTGERERARFFRVLRDEVDRRRR